MASAIDPAKPADGVPAVKADLRANLQAARNEIETLQTEKIQAGDPLDMQGAVLRRPELRDFAETSPEVAVDAGALTLDLATGSVFEATLTADASLALVNPPVAGKAGSVTLIVRQDATGARSLTWPAAVKWAGGVAPVVSPAPGALDVYTLLTRDGGATWFGFAAGQGFA